VGDQVKRQDCVLADGVYLLTRDVRVQAKEPVEAGAG
jgi:hypothetical protein